MGCTFTTTDYVYFVLPASPGQAGWAKTQVTVASRREPLTGATKELCVLKRLDETIKNVEKTSDFFSHSN